MTKRSLPVYPKRIFEKIKLLNLAQRAFDTIAVDQYELPILKSSQDSLKMDQKAAHIFDVIGDFLKLPMRVFSAIFSKGVHLTPGRHQLFSKYSQIDRFIRILLKGFYYTVGIVGFALFLAVTFLGVFFKFLAICLKDYPFEYDSSCIKNKKTNPLVTSMASSLTSLTRNVSLLPDGISYFNHLRSSEERLSEIIDSIVDAVSNAKVDVIFLQEVFGKRMANNIKDKLKAKVSNLCTISHIMPSAMGLDSGLFFATTKNVLHARFIRPPLPKSMASSKIKLPFFNQEINNPLCSTFSIEGWTNKGILLVLIEHDGQYDIAATMHAKSNSSSDIVERQAIEATRAQGLRVLAQSVFNFAEDMEKQFNIKVNLVHFGGDLNVSDIQETGLQTNERKGDNLSFIFKNLFPAPVLETWLMKENKLPNAAKTGFGQENYMSECQPVPGVCFDQTGLFTYRALKCKKHPDCMTDYELVVKTFGEEYSKGKGSPSSDHLGLISTPIERCLTAPTLRKSLSLTKI